MEETTEVRDDGYGDTLTIVRQYLNDEMNTCKGQIIYKGKTTRKTAKGELAHHTINRWINDNLIRVIHARKGLI